MPDDHATELELATPHYAKLRELLTNDKLPEIDKQTLEKVTARYRNWVASMDALTSEGDDRVQELITLLNDYKLFIDLEFIFDSTEDFLYRQSGQLKLSSSIIEEFLPRLVHPSIIPALRGKTYKTGPQKAFSSAYFATTLQDPAAGAGLQIRTKDQDFTVGRPAYLQASFSQGFPAADTTTHKVFLAFVAAECKTNLDKTMFQEAAATAHDVKSAIPGAHYYLVCEWLDMTPISTTGTDIDEVIILRHRRIGANTRKEYAKAAARKNARQAYATRLQRYPFRTDMVMRLVNHLRNIFGEVAPNEEDVLTKGYF